MAETDLLTTEDARYLLRRATFGPSPKDVDTYTGMTRGEAADRLLGYKITATQLKGKDHEELHNRWAKYLITAKSGLQEKLTLFWHDHFATAISKVDDPEFMGVQNLLFRQMGKGSFKDLVKAVNRDPAMVDWLDTQLNVKQQPNENYARELMELFTLGVVDFAGKANYAQQDVAQIARAFTGWQRVIYPQGGEYKRGGTLFHSFPHEFYFDADGSIADPYGRGPKVVFDTPVDQASPPGDIPPPVRNYAPTRASEGEAEIDTIVDILFEHRDSQGYNTVARRTARRLLEYFSHPEPSIAFVDDVVSLSAFGSGSGGSWSIAALVKQIFVHDDFYPRTNPGKPASVKWPIDFLVQTLRLLKARPRARAMYVGFPHGQPVFTLLTDMGQVLFEPPSVFGWEWETAWVSTTGVLARAAMVRGLLYGANIRPERLIRSSLTDPAEIVDEIAAVLGVAHRLSAPARATLIDFLSMGGTATVIDFDDDLAYSRVQQVVSLVLLSPAYQVH